jgi:PPOX class probable F420-dependent enzyme
MGVTIPQAVRKRLKQARVARLATTDVKGQPHIVPICFVLDGTAIYTALDRKPKRVQAARLRRVRNIAATGRAAVVIDDYSEDWTRLWYVLLQGRARLVTALSQRARAIRKLRNKYPQYAGGMLADDAVVIRIDVEKVTAWGAI